MGEDQGAVRAINIQLALLLDAEGRVVGLVQPEETESIKIDRAAVNASARGCVKRSDGELLMNRIRHAMEDRGLTPEMIECCQKCMPEEEK